MKRKAQSQWDFGELFPPEPPPAKPQPQPQTKRKPTPKPAEVEAPPPARRVFTVGELTKTVRRLLEKEVGDVWVTGEVSNLRAQSSGHIYFTLKDGSAQLSCVLFRGEPVTHRDFLKDGQKLNLQGALTVYEPRGQYQLIVRAVEPQGLGALQVAFEKLKRKLQGEGLFAQERKRPLPRYPQRIGLITSPTGAAIRDVLHVIARRQPSLELVLVPCRVQGDEAAGEIAAAIGLLNQWHAQQASTEGLDLILVTRGGGSLEDLWAFNEEVVARAIFESGLPVVSAVGHEIDFTISDFVADVRAPTPSAAAEVITEGPFASRQFVAGAARRMRQLAVAQLASERDSLRQLTQRLRRVHPRQHLEEQLQYLDDLQTRLNRCVRQSLRVQQTAWLNFRQRLVRVKPSAQLIQRRQVIQDQQRRLKEQWRRRADNWKNALANLQARLTLLGPTNVLARGYSITTDDASGQVLRASGDAKSGQRLRTRLHSGEVRSVVEE